VFRIDDVDTDRPVGPPFELDVAPASVVVGDGRARLGKRVETGAQEGPLIGVFTYFPLLAAGKPHRGRGRAERHRSFDARLFSSIVLYSFFGWGRAVLRLPVATLP
jgi:hypothetical protein